MVGGIWGQTRSYGVAATPIIGFCLSVLWCCHLQCLYFLRRREPGAGDKAEAEISQPGGAELSDQRAQAVRLWASDNFGSGYAGLRNLPA